jgi:hypothetical protein
MSASHNACMENQGGHCHHFPLSSRGHTSETLLQKAYIHLGILSLYCGVNSPSVGLVIHFLFTLYLYV